MVYIDNSIAALLAPGGSLIGLTENRPQGPLLKLRLTFAGKSATDLPLMTPRYRESEPLSQVPRTPVDVGNGTLVLVPVGPRGRVEL